MTTDNHEQPLRTCYRCGRTLPIEQFERYKTGTRRKVCNRCKYLYYTQPAHVRWVLKQVEQRRNHTGAA
jgi:hypothetical protein